MTASTTKTSDTAEKKADTTEKTTTTPRKAPAKKHTVTDLVTTDLINQETSDPAALGAYTDELQATVAEKNGYVVLSLQNRGMIGVEPVQLRGESIGQLRELLDDLDAQADKRVKDRK